MRRALFAASAMTLAVIGCPSRAAVATPDQRADRLVASMTDAQKDQMIVSAISEGSAGVIRGVPSLGLPPLRMTDGTAGVFRWLTDVPYVSIPSGEGLAATWDAAAVADAYSMVAREARRAGMAVLLAPGANLVRDLRGGRTYEYFGEDPLLSGRSAASAITAIQAEKVVATLKHFALNDQETARHTVDVRIGEAAMRESDLLAFEIAVAARPGAVMCAYNRVNGVYACQDHHLLTDILKRDWGFEGWVMTDWGAATDAVRSANGGLDQYSAGVTEGGAPNPFMAGPVTFGAPLRQAIAEGLVSSVRRDDMVRRILRSAYAVGVLDDPPALLPLDASADIAVARRVETEAIVLLENHGVLPLDPRTRSIAVIGGRADTSVLSKITTIPGDRKKPFGDPPVPDANGKISVPSARPVLWAHSSPMKALQTLLPRAVVRFDAGDDPARSADLARGSDVAIVFAIQDTNEGEDLASLRLRPAQERLIEAVAAANRRTIVVLENGTAVTMPWAGRVAGLMVAWYPGSGGGEAIGDVLAGRAVPSGKLPVTFPRDERDQPRAVLPGAGAAEGTDNQLTTMGGNRTGGTSVDYDVEGSEVGYRWFHRRGLPVAYPFGYGLSYASFRYGQPSVVASGGSYRVSFLVRNVGKVRAREISQVYLEKPFRLVGFASTVLEAGESRRVTVVPDRRLISNWSTSDGGWRPIGGRLSFAIGGSSIDTPIRVTSGVRDLRPASGTRRVDGQ